MPGFEELQRLLGEAMAEQIDREMTMTDFDLLIGDEKTRKEAIEQFWELVQQHGYNRSEAGEIVRRRVTMTGSGAQCCMKSTANQEGDEIVFRCSECEGRIGQIRGADFEQYRYDELQRFAWRMMIEHVCYAPPMTLKGRETIGKQERRRKMSPLQRKRTGKRMIRIGIEWD
jgi:hypothetical protein